MAFEKILIEKKDRVGLITLNRPEKFNTFNTKLAEELNAGLRQMDEDTEVRNPVFYRIEKQRKETLDARR